MLYHSDSMEILSYKVALKKLKNILSKKFEVVKTELNEINYNLSYIEDQTRACEDKMSEEEED